MAAPRRFAAAGAPRAPLRQGGREDCARPRLMWRSLRSRRLMTGGMVLLLLLGITEGSLLAEQRAVKSKILNYPNTPVHIKQAKVMLVETFLLPTQAWTPEARGSRVRYANQAGQTPSTFVLEGTVLCVNKSSQAIEGIGLSLVFLDLFHQPIQPAGLLQPGALLRKPIVVSLSRGDSTRVSWQHPVGMSSEIYEVAVVVTTVRFADGSVWQAPREELLDVFTSP